MTQTNSTTTAGKHRFVAFESPVPSETVVRELAVRTLNQYTGWTLGRKKWAKHPPFRVNWFLEKQGQKIPRTSKDLTLDLVEAALRGGRFDFQAFDLWDPRDNWLDATVDVGMFFHAPDQNGTKALTMAGVVPIDNFPLTMELDREGGFYTSFQLRLINRIAQLRNALVATSDAPTSDDWFERLRSIVSDCVSLIDVTLHQLWFKAQYSPLAGWSFDPSKLGTRHGQRLDKKLEWVHKITKRQLDARDEVAAFLEIKNLRNHLQHFDPPCFCYTVEDACRWINLVLDVARLNLKMRDRMAARTPVQLLELLLQPRVRFVPPNPQARRLPQPATAGYASSSAETLAAKTPPPDRVQQVIDRTFDESRAILRAKLGELQSRIRAGAPANAQTLADEVRTALVALFLNAEQDSKQAP